MIECNGVEWLLLCSDRHFYWVNIRLFFVYNILSVQTNISNIFFNICFYCGSTLRWNRSYTIFRQAFLLIQYSFICKQYIFLFRQRISIFFWQMVNKTAYCFNNIFFSTKNLLKKWKTTQRWKRSYDCLTGTPSCCG